MKDLRINLCNFTYVADVFAFGKLLFALEKTAVLTADTYSLYAREILPE